MALLLFLSVYDLQNEHESVTLLAFDTISTIENDIPRPVERSLKVIAHHAERVPSFVVF